MKIFYKNPLRVIAAAALIMSFLAPIASAALTPSLGFSLTYAILAKTYTNIVAGTTINGSLGYTTGPAATPTVNGETHIADASYNQAGIDQNSALANLNSQPCISIGVGAVNLNAITIGANPPGTFPPGCWQPVRTVGLGRDRTGRDHSLAIRRLNHRRGRAG